MRKRVFWVWLALLGGMPLWGQSAAPSRVNSALGELLQMAGVEELPTPEVPAITDPGVPVPAPAPEYRVDLDASSVKFEVDTKLGTFKGKMKRFEVQARINREDLTKSEFFVMMDMNSASLDSLFLPNSFLKKALRTKECPTSTLKMLAIRPGPQPNFYEVDVELLFRGETTAETLTLGLDFLEGGLVRMSGAFSKLVDSKKGTVSFNLLLKPN